MEESLQESTDKAEEEQADETKEVCDSLVKSDWREKVKVCALGMEGDIQIRWSIGAGERSS